MMDPSEERELATYDQMSYGLQDDGVQYKKSPVNRCVVVTVVATALIALALGVIIGWFSRAPDSAPVNKATETAAMKMQHGVDFILHQLDKDNMKKNLKQYTSRPRLTGTAASLELVNDLADQWRKNGLESVRTPSYDVLLSYPNKTDPNKLEIVTLTGETTGVESAAFEKPLDDEGKNPEIVPPYNSFAPNGTAEGDLVYVNYGRIEDFFYLINNLSLDLTGKLAIARYGKIFRGNKVKNAQRFNMSGIVMYTDPSDFNINGTNNTYPHSWWMPETGVQRGTVGFDGDYLTPLYPATDYAHRLKAEDVLDIKIPAQPISYGDAKKFLRELGGVVAPDNWQGSLGFTYRLGPGLRNSSLKVRLTVNNYMEMRTIKNVIGYIRGEKEPDRYVLLGNHHDAWVFGAIDPLSGAAVMTEITRVFGELLKNGYRPRRTIVFCAWDGEETGLLGSTEWVEEHMKELYERAVAYLNVDYAVDYTDYLMAGTSPLLQDPLYEAAKQVPNPDSASSLSTLYDAWKHKSPMKKGDPNSEPSVYYSLGSGSDMATFYQRAGVPSIDMWYTYDEGRWDILSYPLYHSAYETFRMYTTFIDPSFNFTLATGRLWAILAWNLANDLVLKFDVSRYATAIESFITTLDSQFAELWKKQNVNMDALKSASANFTEATASFRSRIKSKTSVGPLTARIINDKLIQLERVFIDPEGLPDRRLYKHVLFAPSKYDSYQDNSFPGITDTMFDIEQNGEDKWELLKQQVYVATYTIQSAANTLEDIAL